MLSGEGGGEGEREEEQNTKKWTLETSRRKKKYPIRMDEIQSKK